jgi:DNA-binding transcriptional ArsR family regulator
MTGWVSIDEPVLAAATTVAREMGDPIRLTVLQLLAHEGPHGMTQLAEILDLTPARLGNHLTRLRASGLVTAEHHGRHVTYRIAHPDTTFLLDALARYAGGRLPIPGLIAHPSRLCYDHAAGELGVGILDTLLDQDALRRPDPRTDQLIFGPTAEMAMAHFGLDLDEAIRGRRKPATQCLDRSLRRPHLGGALGAEILNALVLADLIHLGEDKRELTINEQHRHRLTRLVPSLA